MVGFVILSYRQRCSHTLITNPFKQTFMLLSNITLL